MSYSNGSGGTLTLPSPTHVHRVDVSSAVRSIRRSLSRSPSKLRLSGTVSPTPASSSGLRQPPASTVAQISQQQQQPPPASPAPGPAQAATLAGPTSPTFSTPQPSTASPFRPNSIKLSVRSTRSKPASARPLSRTRVSPKSPLKRAFGASADSGNPISSSLTGLEARGQENISFSDFALTFSPASRRALEKPSRHSMHLDVSGSSKNGITKFLEINSDSFPPISVSPLKRSDATMGLGQTNLGSPVAKRRSVHGIPAFDAAAGDFNNIFGQPTTPATPAAPAPAPGTPATPLPESRAQTPLQTSQGFDIHEDANHEYQLTGSSAAIFRDSLASPTPSSLPKRSSSLRKSTLQQRHGDGRSSFSRRSVHQLAQGANEGATPVSRSRPRLALDSYAPLEERPSLFGQAPLPNPSAHPLQLARQPNQPHPLSRSLTQSSSSSSLPDDSPTHVPVQVGERPRVPLNFSKSLPPGSRPPVSDEDGMATPQYKQAKPLQAAFMSTGLVSKMNRNPELGPTRHPGAKTLTMPDTPCKKQPYNSATFPPQPGSGGRRARSSFGGSPSSPFAGPIRGNVFGTQEKGGGLFFEQLRSSHSRKSSMLSLDGDEIAGSQDDFPPPTPTKNLFFKSITSTTPAQPPPRLPRGSRTFGNPSSIFGLGGEQTTSLFNTSPLDHERQPPQTPQDSMAPPDPSGLSISNHSKNSRPPATPTTGPRQLFSSFGSRRLSMTPQHEDRPRDVDESLLSRFEKVEPIGKGEFSQVYRVVKSQQPSSLFMNFATTPNQRTPPSPDSNRVFAVKKLRLPYHGARGREARQQEVHILKALTHSSKVIQYFDSWEHNGHLYIQTEYCAEGSLNVFLEDIGQGGRLDDFRIWKILLETAQGLTAIHNAGFMHLDLKPANIFVTFDGHLKIGDFGMAAPYPAPAGIEGEGDREYIGPEILLGQYDRPADIFALGLIILEIACNVFLPDNGPTWQALRALDLSVVPTLTCGETGAMLRDANGVPIEDSGLALALGGAGAHSTTYAEKRRGSFAFENDTMTHDPRNLFGAPRRTELQDPPAFMTDPDHPHSMDSLVKWMIQPDPSQRPTADQLLDFEAVAWVSNRRRAGATVFEGNWGPYVGHSVEEMMDTEMTDV